MSCRNRACFDGVKHIFKEDPREGGALHAQMLTHTNEVSPQILGNVCETQNVSCFSSVLQISHKKFPSWSTLTRNIQKRTFWEMSFSLAKLIHYKATAIP